MLACFNQNHLKMTIKIYFLHGNDSFTRKRRKLALLKEISERIGSNRISKFNLDSVDFSKVENQLRQKLIGSSLFAEKEIVSVNLLAETLNRRSAISSHSSVKDNQIFYKQLEKFWKINLPQLAEHIYLIIEAPKKWLVSSYLIKNFSQSSESQVEVFQLPPVKKKWDKKNNLLDFARKLAKEKGLILDWAILNQLVEKSEGDLWFLASAIDQIDLFSRSRAGKIQPEEIEAMLNLGEEKNIFMLFDAMGEGDKRKVFTLLYEIGHRNSLIPEKEIPAILGFVSLMARQLKQMLAVKEGASQSEAQKDWGLSPFFYNKVRLHASFFSLDFLKKAFLELVKVQENAKRGLYSPLWLVDFFVIYLIYPISK